MKYLMINQLVDLTFNIQIHNWNTVRTLADSTLTQLNFDRFKIFFDDLQNNTGQNVFFS